MPTSTALVSQLSEREPVLTIFRRNVMNPIIISSLSLFLYGLYILLFRISIVLLKRRKKSRERSFHQISLRTLFVLASIGVPLGLAHDVLATTKPVWRLAGLGLPFPAYQKDLSIRDIVFYVTPSFTVDTILIFRCFVMFGYRRRFVVIPIVACIIIDLGAIICGILDLSIRALGLDAAHIEVIDTLSDICVGCNALLNILLTTALAGRIWSISWKGEIATKRSSTIVSILLESGLLYLLTLAVMAVGNLLEAETFDIGSIMIQVSGIAPTLIIVRANIGRRLEVEDENQTQDSDHRCTRNEGTVLLGNVCSNRV
ncbi:hypothetical protein E1B28_004977 [Marasmius oreades]|uniref:Uncharacterized protein n=1 Tax=Marasmius oreades TaxID=181124 RepID=A0A9P7UZN5_9AGAR|nr:uncharacterized protein E1B28_004977 [Marasmius oreades]KAG7097645.1 hypothetical protein E1B28_004977 [Marasmius oreades]